MKKKSSTYTSQEVCDRFDVTKNTLFRWEREGKIKKVGKDWRGWRVFTDENIIEIKRIITEKKRQNE